MDMEADVRVLVFFLCFATLFHSSHGEKQSLDLGDIMGALGNLGQMAGTGDKCQYKCPNGE